MSNENIQSKIIHALMLLENQVERFNSTLRYISPLLSENNNDDEQSSVVKWTQKNYRNGANSN